MVDMDEEEGVDIKDLNHELQEKIFVNPNRIVKHLYILSMSNKNITLIQLKQVKLLIVGIVLDHGLVMQ